MSILVDRDGATVFGFVLAIVGIAVAVFIAGAAILIPTMRAYGRNQCSNWGNQSGYETKYIVPGFLDTGTCLAKTNNGSWVKNTAIITIKR